VTLEINGWYIGEKRIKPGKAPWGEVRRAWDFFPCISGTQRLSAQFCPLHTHLLFFSEGGESCFLQFGQRKTLISQKGTSGRVYFGLGIKVWCHRTGTSFCLFLPVSAWLTKDANVSDTVFRYMWYRKCTRQMFRGQVHMVGTWNRFPVHLWKPTRRKAGHHETWVYTKPPMWLLYCEISKRKLQVS